MIDIVQNPDAELGIDLSLDDLVTPEHCQLMLDRLTRGVAKVEMQLANPTLEQRASPSWKARAQAALRLKKSWMPRVQSRCATLVRDAKRVRHDADLAATRASRDTKFKTLIDIGWEVAPEVMMRIQVIARERHPTLFMATRDVHEETIR